METYFYLPQGIINDDDDYNNVTNNNNNSYYNDNDDNDDNMTFNFSNYKQNDKPKIVSIQPITVNTNNKSVSPNSLINVSSINMYSSSSNTNKKLYNGILDLKFLNSNSSKDDDNNINNNKYNDNSSWFNNSLSNSSSSSSTRKTILTNNTHKKNVSRHSQLNNRSIHVEKHHQNTNNQYHQRPIQSYIDDITKSSNDKTLLSSSRSSDLDASAPAFLPSSFYKASKYIDDKNKYNKNNYSDNNELRRRNHRKSTSKNPSSSSSYHFLNSKSFDNNTSSILRQYDVSENNSTTIESIVKAMEFKHTDDDMSNNVDTDKDTSYETKDNETNSTDEESHTTDDNIDKSVNDDTLSQSSSDRTSISISPSPSPSPPSSMPTSARHLEPSNLIVKKLSNSKKQLQQNNDDINDSITKEKNEKNNSSNNECNNNHAIVSTKISKKSKRKKLKKSKRKSTEHVMVSNDNDIDNNRNNENIREYEHKIPIKKQSQHKALKYVAQISKKMKQYMYLMKHFILSLISLQIDAIVRLQDNQHLVFCCVFLFSFPYFVHTLQLFSPPWIAPCLLYAFLMQTLSTSGPLLLILLSRIILPLQFLTDGGEKYIILLQWNGCKRLLLAFILSCIRRQIIFYPRLLLMMCIWIWISVLYGQYSSVQWIFITHVLHSGANLSYRSRNSHRPSQRRISHGTTSLVKTH